MVSELLQVTAINSYSPINALNNNTGFNDISMTNIIIIVWNQWYMHIDIIFDYGIYDISISAPLEFSVHCITIKEYKYAKEKKKELVA